MFTRKDIEKRARNVRELLRASELLRSGLHRCCIVDGDFCAIARGSGLEYRVRVTASLDGSTCTCVSFRRGGRGWCKHVAAAAMRWLGGDFSAAAIDTELVGAIEALDLFEAREVLLEAAARDESVRRRLTGGAWDDGRAAPAVTNMVRFPLAPARTVAATPGGHRRARRDSGG